MKKSIVVIGGGMAGTAAAYTLVKRGYTVTIVEKSSRLGGRIRSEIVHGAAVEMGAGFITRAYSNVHAFLNSNGLNEKLFRQHSKPGILKDGTVRMATLGTLASTEVLSWTAKRQALPLLFRLLANWPHIDIHAPWLLDTHDTRSIADMLRSSSQKEFLEYVLEPVLDGYCYWSPEHTSEAMLFLIGKEFLLSSTSKFRGGLQQIPLKAATGSVVLKDREVRRVEQEVDGTYRIAIELHGKSQTLYADGLVCATPAFVVPQIITGLSKQQRQFFSSIDYSSAVVMARTYKQEQTCGDKSIAFPRMEGTQLSAITVAPEPGKNKDALSTVKVYASGAVSRQLSAKSDDSIIRTLIHEMEPVRTAVLVGNAQPIATHVQRWTEALPLFDVGHFQRLRSFANGDIESPNQALVFAGDYIGLPCIEGAFTSGVQAAERLDRHMSLT